MSEPPEYGGWICCDPKTQKVSSTAPERGEVSKIPFDGKQIYTGGSVDTRKLKPCPHGTKPVAAYHSHPPDGGANDGNGSGSKFSYSGDEGLTGTGNSDDKWVNLNLKPLFLGAQDGSVKRLDMHQRRGPPEPGAPAGQWLPPTFTSSTVSNANN